MKTFKRIALLILVLLIGFVLYTFTTTGYFRTVENKSDGQILKRVKLPGAEDITISYKDSFALISSTDRSVYPPLDQEIGGLYYMKLNNRDFEVQHLTKDFPTGFAPHGISMISLDSTYKVAAINHTKDGHSIELFHLEDQQLSHQKTLIDPMIKSPNDLVFVDENRFYFTNDHGYTEGFGKLLEDYLGLSKSK